MDIVSFGLDISTHVVGIAAVTKQCEFELAHVDLSKFEGPWEKADEFEKVLKSILQNGKLFNKATHFFVENAALKFQSGSSSAATIGTLMQFNGVASYIARNLLHLTPTFIACTHARKVCGMKMQQAKKVGIDHKQQVFDYMSTHDLKNVVWPTNTCSRGKNKGKVSIEGFCYDEVDAYVVAMAGLKEYCC